LAHPRIVNRSMEVLEKDGGIIFLRRLREGPTAESYGIHVARLAGLSPAVLDRAELILLGIRNRGSGIGEEIARSKEQSDFVNHQDVLVNKEATHGKAKNIIENPEFAAVLRNIRFLDPNKITPLEALGFVNEWKQRLAGHSFEAHANGDTVEPPVSPPAMNKKPQSSKDADSTPSLFD